MPKESVLEHGTILKMADVASISNRQMAKMLPFARKDVKIQPYAEKFMAESNRALDDFITSTKVPLQMAVTTESEMTEVSVRAWVCVCLSLCLSVFLSV